MRSAVIDSGVLLASLLPDEKAFQSVQLMQQLQTVGTALHAPVLLRY